MKLNHHEFINHNFVKHRAAFIWLENSPSEVQILNTHRMDLSKLSIQDAQFASFPILRLIRAAQLAFE